MPEIKVCTSYDINGKTYTSLPANMNLLPSVKPVYETRPSWDEDISGITQFDDLPETAQSYVKNIEAWLGVPVQIISVGPDRHQTILRKMLF